MWYAAIIRFLRRRIILGLILTLSLCYCIISYVGKVGLKFTGITVVFSIFRNLQSEFLDSDDVVPVKRTQPFIWRTLQQHNATNDIDDTCRNSVQGKVLIVDDRGTLQH